MSLSATTRVEASELFEAASLARITAWRNLLAVAGNTARSLPMPVRSEGAFAALAHLPSAVVDTFVDANACLWLSTRTGFGYKRSVSFFVILAFGCSQGFDSSARSIAASFGKAVAI